MTTTHAGCFRWYGKCKHMNRIWVTIERMCKRTAKKSDIGNKSELSIKTCSVNEAIVTGRARLF